MARKEKELHLQLHPGWSARDNYGTHVKKKKRKKEETIGDLGESSGKMVDWDSVRKYVSRMAG